MADSFFTLVPERIKFGQFWVEIRKRNRWLIMLRYGAVAMLSFLVLGLYLLDRTIEGFEINILPLFLIAAAILAYNIIFHRIWIILPKIKIWIDGPNATEGQKGLHSLHFSLAQIICDFVSLLLFVYYTGGVESPFYPFFIFHVIIGSLFFTQEVIGTIVTLTVLLSIGGSVLEIIGAIPHHAIIGFLSSPLYDNPAYIIMFFAVFAISLFTSIYLANSIAKELYQRERALTITYSKLENAEKTKSKYVQSVVHDLKTPIAAALTYLNMILEGNLGEIHEAQQKPIERSTARLSSAIHTINDILNISQLQIESSIENIESINICEVFQEIIHDLNVIIESKKLDFTYKCDSENPVIDVEPKLAKLSLANLVSNAVKYTEPGGKIELILDDDKENLRISISDNGIGIPEKEQAKIFNSFYRSSVSKQKGIEGTGLGMSIVSDVVQKYHGTIELISPSYLYSGEDRPGTQFIISIPKKFSVL